MILLIVLGQSSFFAANIMEGLIWFVLPSHLVIINDIMAYLFGFFFGRTPLIKLSPKKTWEGFLGALVTTLAVSWHLSRYLAQYQWLVCPRKDLTIRTWVHCEPANTFKALPAAETLDPLPAPLRNFVLRRLSPDATLLPLQLHALAFAFFAAVIAPFGGFFASGFKRALRVKDFGATIPGHGGITDRMDCQLVMAVFSYIYIEGIVGLGDVSVSLLVEKAQRLSTADKLELYKLLGQMLGKPYQ
jgi:phosphatidate cytidylyltransferase